jgi:CHAT domain-containing protein/tetratricopeptide (TPR) repeat protein
MNDPEKVPSGAAWRLSIVRFRCALAVSALYYLIPLLVCDAAFAKDKLLAYQEALSLAESSDNYLAAAALHNLIGESHEDKYDFQKALLHYERGVQILDAKHAGASGESSGRELSGEKGYAESYGAAISVDLYRGRITDLTSLLAKPPIESHQELCVLLFMNTGNMYLKQAQYQQAEGYYKKALGIVQNFPVQSFKQELLANLAWSAIKQHRMDDAQQKLDTALSVPMNPAETTNIRRAVLALGAYYREEHNFAKAVRELERALVLYKDANDIQGTGRATAHLATTYLQMGELGSAKSGYLKALMMNESLQDQEIAWHANGGLAKTFDQMNDYEQALRHYRAYWEVVDKIGKSLQTDPGRVSFLEEHGKMLDDYARVAIKSAALNGDYASARQVLERRRGRTLELLRSSLGLLRNRVPIPGHLPALYALGASDAFERRCGAPIMANESILHRRGCSWGKFESYQETQKQTTSPTTFLEYYVLEDETAIFLKGIDGKIHGSQVKIKSEELEAIANEYVRALGGDDLRGIGVVRGNATKAPAIPLAPPPNWDELSQRLYTLLIKPIERYLPNDSKLPLVLVPHRMLWRVPFAALQNTNHQFLNDQHSLSYAPSEATWQAVASRPRKHDHRHARAWVVGNPRMPDSVEACGETFTLSALPGAQEEAKEVTDLFKSEAEAELFTGSEADRLRLQAWYRDFSVLHFATHGFACPREPLDSSIVLSTLTREEIRLDKTTNTLVVDADPRLPIQLDNDELRPEVISTDKFYFPGLLSARTIMTVFKLDADLVTLSACQTGLGKLIGEGMIGFTRAFLGAGARSLLASLWSVDDEGTKDLMITFYRQYLEHGNKALALQSAMKETRKRHPSPSSWAAFALYGAAQ